MARNLAYELRAAYDEALSRYDVLVMPTTPIHATAIPDPDAPREEIIGRALEMVGQHLRHSTSPATRPAASPPGSSTVCPTGMMIVGRQFDDATVLRVAHTYEQAVGGFPTPAGAAAGSQA